MSIFDFLPHFFKYPHPTGERRGSKRKYVLALCRSYGRGSWQCYAQELWGLGNSWGKEEREGEREKVAEESE